MSFTIVIATHGKEEWSELAKTRAYPSAMDQGAEVLIGHDIHGTRASMRNALTEKATGDWIITLDADDELAPGYVTAMEKALDSIPLEDWEKPHLLTPMLQEIEHGRKGVPFFWPERDLAEGNWMVVGTVFSRWLFWKVGGWRSFYGSGVLNEWDDWDLWIRCWRAGAEIVKVPDAVYIAHVSDSPHYKRTREMTQAWLKEIREANNLAI